MVLNVPRRLLYLRFITSWYMVHLWYNMCTMSMSMSTVDFYSASPRPPLMRYMLSYHGIPWYDNMVPVCTMVPIVVVLVVYHGTSVWYHSYTMVYHGNTMVIPCITLSRRLVRTRRRRFGAAIRHRDHDVAGSACSGSGSHLPPAPVRPMV